MPRLHFDLGLGKLVQAPGLSGLLNVQDFKLGDSTTVEVLFSRGGVPEQLTGDVTEMIFVVKSSRAELAPPLMLANEWTFADGVWSGTLFPNNTLLLAELGTDPDKKMLAEFTFTTSVLGTTSSQTLVARVENDLWKGTEGSPLEELTPENWLEARRPAPMLRTAIPEDGVPAFHQTNFSNVNNDLRFTQVSAGTAPTIRYTDGGAALDPTVQVLVVGRAIEVRLLTTAGVCYRTANEIRTAVLASSAATALVSVANAAGNDGTGEIGSGFAFGPTALVSPTPGTTPAALHQTCRVAHANSNGVTTWIATQVFPPRWKPIESDMVRDESSNTWKRLYISGGVLLWRGAWIDNEF